MIGCSLNHILRNKRFRGVEKQREIEERDFRCFARPKIGRKPKTRKEGGGGGKLPLYLPLFLFFLLSPHFSRGQNIDNPVPRSFFAFQPNGNACYAGYIIIHHITHHYLIEKNIYGILNKSGNRDCVSQE